MDLTITSQAALTAFGVLDFFIDYPPLGQIRIVKSYLPSPLGGEGQGEGKEGHLGWSFTPTLSLPPQGGGFPLSFRILQNGFPWLFWRHR
jgi:hypothetical protein